MIPFDYIEPYSQIIVFIIAWILCFSAFKLLKVPGNISILSILSLLIALALATSKKASDYVFHLLPYLTILLIVSVIILLILMFMMKDIGPFRTFLVWACFVIGLILVVAFAFSHFPSLGHMTPNSSNEGLSESMQDFKIFIYSPIFKNSFIFVICIVIVGILILKFK